MAREKAKGKPRQRSKPTTAADLEQCADEIDRLIVGPMRALAQRLGPGESVRSLGWGKYRDGLKLLRGFIALVELKEKMRGP